MKSPPISFLTPYWSGTEMMRIHLASIRRFHADAPILISKRGGEDREMEDLRREFGINYWLEDCGYTDAYVRLLQRCQSQYACVLDHDTVLLSALEPLLAGLTEGRYDLVGIEERIRLPESVAPDSWPDSNGWLRFAPGCTASNFLIFDWRAFESRWGLQGIMGTPVSGARHFDFDYGIGQKLARHLYLSPFHTRRYGLGNLLKHGDTPVVWHQWYGAYRMRLAGETTATPGPGDRAVYSVAEAGERAFIVDYPQLALDDLSPAWGPDADVEAEQRAIRSSRRFEPGKIITRLGQRLRRLKSYGLRKFVARAISRLGRWWRLG